MKKMTFVLLLVAIVTNCGKRDEQKAALMQKQREAPSIQGEEYAVYSSLLKEYHKSPNDGGPIKQFVVEDTTQAEQRERCIPEDIFESHKQQITPSLKAALDEFKEKNREYWKLSNRFALEKPITLVSGKEIESFFENREEDGWGKFYKRYPKSPGVVTFSRVGFNADKTEAFVYKVNSCGWLCAGGNYYILRKENGVWGIKNVLNCWVS